MSGDMPKIYYGFGKFPPALLEILIRPVGYRNFMKMQIPTRYIYLKDQLKAFKQDLYAKYGGQSNYLKQWRLLNGYKRKIDYENYLARSRGFSSQNEYLNYRYQLRGFKDRADFQRWKRSQSKGVPDVDTVEQ